MSELGIFTFPQLLKVGNDTNYIQAKNTLDKANLSEGEPLSYNYFTEVLKKSIIVYMSTQK